MKNLQNQYDILTLTSLNGFLGSDKQDRLNQKGILTLTILNCPTIFLSFQSNSKTLLSHMVKLNITR